MAYADILARLKTDVEAVSGIGKVYDYRRLVKKDQVRSERFVDSTGKFHFWEISREDGAGSSDYNTLVVKRDLWSIEGWYALDDSAESEKTFQAVVNDVVDALNQDRLLNDTGYIVEPIETPEFNHEMKADVLCHHSKIQATILRPIDCS